MKLGLFNPYSSASREAPILSLLSSSVSNFGHIVNTLSCDGCFSSCDRKVTPESGLKRKLIECFSCRRDADLRSSAIGCSDLYVSSFLSKDDLQATYRWAWSFDFRSVADQVFDNENVLWLCRNSLKLRYGTADGALKIPGIEPEIRALFLSAVRAVVASRNFYNRYGLDLILLSGRDFVAESFYCGVKGVGGRVARFIVEQQTGMLNITHPDRNEVLTLDADLETSEIDLADSTTWSTQVNDHLKEIFLFLEIPSEQLALFAAS